MELWAALLRRQPVLPSSLLVACNHRMPLWRKAANLQAHYGIACRKCTSRRKALPYRSCGMRERVIYRARINELTIFTNELYGRRLNVLRERVEARAIDRFYASAIEFDRTGVFQTQ